jgi:hypothetical protein
MEKSPKARTALKVVAIVVIGIVLGAGSAVAGFLIAIYGGGVNNGAWSTNLGIGSETANPYLRAAVAIGGLLALNPAETMYYSADKDSDGNNLDANCSYRIEGKAPDARWWSVTVYGADGYLIPDVGRYSYSLTELTPDSNGVYTIYISKARQPGAWLSLGNESTFHLSLRLYNPGQSVRSNPGKAELPRITREECK